MNEAAMATSDAAPCGGDKVRRLARLKWTMTGLLVLCTGLFLAARLHHGEPAWDWLGAFAEAAMVGAMADWFAVVALFRRPMGLPIPHTAILPANKQKLAQNLAEFVRDKFLATETLVAKLKAFDPAARLGSWLNLPANAEWVGDRLAAILLDALRFVDDERVRRLMAEALRSRLDDLDVAGIAGRLLNALTEEGRHQALLDAALVRVADWADSEEAQAGFARMILEVAGSEYPLLLKALGYMADKDEFGRKVSAAVARGVKTWLREIADDASHPRRREFDAAVADFVERLQHDRAFRLRLERMKADLIADPLLGRYLDGLWLDLKAWVVRELEDPASALRGKTRDMARALGQTLASHPGLRATLDEHLESALRALAEDMRGGLANHIAATVSAWKDEELVRELELGIGQDLQYIRLSGTLVGGLLGLALHLIQVGLGGL